VKTAQTPRRGTQIVEALGAGLAQKTRPRPLKSMHVRFDKPLGPFRNAIVRHGIGFAESVAFGLWPLAVADLGPASLAPLRSA
jgi:hypothetical protein